MSATQGFSPRTRTDAQLVRFGAEGARAAVAGRRGEVGLELEVTVRRGEGKRAKLNGAPLRAAEQLRSTVVDARLHSRPARRREGPARRAPRVLRPRPRPLRAGAGAAAGRVRRRGGADGTPRCVARAPACLGRDAIEPWSERVATLGAELVAARLEALELLGAGVRRARRRARPRRRGAPLRRRAADARSARRPCSTATSTAASPSLGPHLDDIVLSAAGRDLRSFGSQGEQRLALLALLLAEAETIADRTRRPAAPPARRRAVRARSRAAADPRRARAQRGPGARHRDRCGDAAGRSRPAARGDPGSGAGGRRLSGAGRRADSRRALPRRSGQRRAATRSTAWPAAVGDGDRAQRVAGADSSPTGRSIVHVARRDLGLRADAAGGRDLGAAAGPPEAAVRSGAAAGRRPREDAVDRRRVEAPPSTRARPPRWPPGSRTRPARICCESHKSRARTRLGRPLVLIHFSLPANAEFAGLFS